eukprot:gnl/TRDRNA2_/TRDRNA2_168766_c0_seq1.p1 gnl/TRDRNA2_/TRDRNA2_168766_c0~~gnl/TRDRNA2_/TRDRNA2_168766_c0_seq1.p1  ORF type:complete len:199 (-),score=37.53 gnl/TRDRNA2_/TRDRNA2_168766_c0_seq1:43-639(-)
MRQEGQKDEEKYGDSVHLSSGSAPKRIPIQDLGDRTGVKFAWEGLEMLWHPVESQRLLLWAAVQGKQEVLAEEISKRHFERVHSCADRSNLLAAVAACGLDAKTAESYLKSDQNEQEVWRSYGDMIHRFGITAIPLFAFTLGRSPFDPHFRQDASLQPLVISGSADEEVFLEVFERLYASLKDLQAAQQTQSMPPAKL